MTNLITSLRLFVLSIVVCSIVYPTIILGFAMVVAPESRQGSLIRNREGTIVGSRLLAQGFVQPGYFWPRPSAVDYNASAAGGSNLSPTNPKIAKRAKEILARLRQSADVQVPADLVATSGSGMDPHITLAAAIFQVPRVAAARELSAEVVEQLVRQQADPPTFSAFRGEPLVNVLDLNLALDALKK